MDRAVGQDFDKLMAIEDEYRISISELPRPRPGNKRARLLLVAGERREAVPAPLVVGECRRNRVPAIDPAFGFLSPAARIG